jgi:hypothetical protein
MSSVWVIAAIISNVIRISSVGYSPNTEPPVCEYEGKLAMACSLLNQVQTSVTVGADGIEPPTAGV